MRIFPIWIALILVLSVSSAWGAYTPGMSDEDCLDEVKSQVKAGIPLSQIAWDAKQADINAACLFNGLNDSLIDRSDIVSVMLDAGYSTDEIRIAALNKGWPGNTVENLIADASQTSNPILNPDLSVSTGGGDNMVQPPPVSPN